METYKGKLVPALEDKDNIITIEDLREHSDERCTVEVVDECTEVTCYDCVYNTLSNTVDYLLYKEHITKAEALELSLSGNKD